MYVIRNKGLGMALKSWPDAASSLLWAVHPTPGVFVSAYSKGVAGGVSVSADSKGLICTKIVQNARLHGSAESKGVRGAAGRQVCSR